MVQSQQNQQSFSPEATGKKSSVTPQPKTDQSSEPTIYDRNQLNDTVKGSYAVEMTDPIDLTLENEVLLDEQMQRLYDLRDRLRANEIQDDFTIRLTVITRDDIDTLHVAELVFEIKTLLHKNTKEGNSIMFQQANSEVLLTEEDALNGFQRLKTLKEYLQAESTPKNLKANFRLRVESPAIFEAITRDLHEINVLTRQFTNVKLSIKTQHGTSPEKKGELEKLYRLRSRYYDEKYALTPERFEEDLEDIQRLLACAAKDGENPTKRISITFPARGLTEKQVRTLSEHFAFFEKEYPATFEVTNLRELAATPAYRPHFYGEVVALGQKGTSIDNARMRLSAIYDELYKRFTGESKATHRILLQAFTEKRIPFELKKLFAKIETLDLWIQKQQALGATNHDFKPGRIPYQSDYLDFDDRHFFKLPGRYRIALQEEARAAVVASRAIGSDLLSISQSIFTGSLSLISGSFARLKAYVPARTAPGRRR